MSEFIKTIKQREAIELMSLHSEVLLEGGSRSGKTFIAVYAFLIRSIKYKNSRHLIVRKHFNHIKASVWYQTFPQVLEIAFPTLKIKENKSDWFIELDNGSQIWIAGTDDKDRVEKILGTEWDSIYLNEASQMDFDVYEILKTRLNPQEDIKELMLIDYNPTNYSHWGYVMFHKKLNFETKQPLENLERYGKVKINPKDNIENLSKGYINTLETMSSAKKRRYYHGNYSSDLVGALWKREWIDKNKIYEVPKDLISIIVAVDPSVTSDKDYDPVKHDMAGIVICGKYKIDKVTHYCIINDCSLTGMKWGEESVKKYHEYKADKIIAEKNQGGELVRLHIRNSDRNVPIDLVHGSRGKETRASPIADLYEKGLIHHVSNDKTDLTDLEEELCSWIPGEGRSPNRMDSLVWGITYFITKSQGRVTERTGW